MAGRGNQRDLFADRIRSFNKIDQAGFEYGLHRIGKRQPLDDVEATGHLLQRRGPILVFRSVQQVARIGKGRRPLAVLLHSSPADMIDVEMRAKHNTKTLGSKARSFKIAQEGCLPIGIMRPARPVLSVTDTCVDDNPFGRRIHHKSMDAEYAAALGRYKMRLKPWQREKIFDAGLGKRCRYVKQLLALNDLGDRDIADFPSL